MFVYGGWGVNGGWMPLPTHPQRYRDPASLVSFVLSQSVVQSQSKLDVSWGRGIVEELNCSALLYLGRSFISG